MSQMKMIPFFKGILSILDKEAQGTIIRGGDCNCVLNMTVDKLPLEHRPPSKKSKAAKYVLEELELVDSCRAKNPSTFFSKVHGSYPRIDLVCISRQSLHKVYECVIEPITLC